MKKQKGFTLIELLAVIAILAIILLIAVPMVLSTIASSKKAAHEKSAMFVYEGVENYIAQTTLAGGTPTTIATADIATKITPYVSVSPTAAAFTITNGVITGNSSITIDGVVCTWTAATKTAVTCAS